MSDKRWKATERRIAALLGGRRVPVSGRGRGDAPDVAHPWLSLEVKDCGTQPAWLLDALDQAEASVTPAQLPAVVLHRAGDRHDAALLVVRLGAFVDWFGPTAPGGRVAMVVVTGSVICIGGMRDSQVMTIYGAVR